MVGLALDNGSNVVYDVLPKTESRIKNYELRINQKFGSSTSEFLIFP
ncbi:hypothetical protein KAW43_00385 [Candidatus Parcubacteria bacterium]|nr:hypothetical protein [Candidatus Parcubacteria bacterium]